MAEKHYTNEPGYKLLTDMVACKKEAKVKSLWIAATPPLQEYSWCPPGMLIINRPYKN
jgi:hypothetical protein